MRLRKVLPYLKRYPDCRLLDIGCGWEARLLRTMEPYIAEGLGVDSKAPKIYEPKLKTYELRLEDRLPFEDASFDVITMLAVMEHLENDEQILVECARLLRPGGGLLVTVPSRYAKPVLEFLSYRVGIVNADEVRDHKRYYNRADLFSLVDGVEGLHIETHQYFQLMFNNFLYVTRAGL